jgi:hypothetical protein
MSLKNHTSGVPASTSISQIECILARHGATQILKEYDSFKRVDGIAFILPIGGN